MRWSEGPELEHRRCEPRRQKTPSSPRLGAVWTTVYPDPDRMLGFTNLFSIPDGVAPFALVTVGYPAIRPPPEERYREDRVHRNVW